MPLLLLRNDMSCGQYYKAPMIVIYNSRVVPDLKLPHITTRVINYNRKLFIRLATGNSNGMVCWKSDENYLENGGNKVILI